MKTNNYIGKQDENRGIIAFFVVFLIVSLIFGIIFLSSKLKGHSDEKGISSIDDMYDELQRTNSDVKRFEIHGDKLIIEGEHKENLNQNLLSKLVNLQLVLKNSEGDKYVFDLDYYISTEGIDYKTYVINGDTADYYVDLSTIEPGEYFAFLRTKTESSKTADGYIYKYYTLENKTGTNELSYETTTVKFDSSKKIESFLTITKE